LSQLYKLGSNATSQPLLVTGMRSSGKSIVLGIIAAYSGRSQIIKDVRFGQIMQLNRYGYISDNVASMMLKHAVNFIFYDHAIGRRFNLRSDDETSLWSNPAIFEEIAKIKSERGADLFDKTSLIPVIDSHNALIDYKLLSVTYTNLKLINVMRSPISIIHSWIRDGLYDNQTTSSKLYQGILISKNGLNLPIIAAYFDEDYEHMTPADRAVFAFDILARAERESRLAIDEKNIQILDLKFIDIVNSPLNVVDEMSKVFGEPNEKTLSIVLRKENLPRNIINDDEAQKYNLITKKISREAKNILDSNIEIFNK
jgi:hypothetical protein